MGAERILITGANGQIGSDLAEALREQYGQDNVITTDLRAPAHPDAGPWDILDVLDKKAIEEKFGKYRPAQVYHLAAMLSAVAEQKPLAGWNLNMNSLLSILQAAVDRGISKVFWPSSIGAFGPGTPKDQTPQHTIMDPTTVYGISKKAGEGWCRYYFEKYGLDVRSIRYPGLISYKTKPGGGTTDYAIAIFHAAKKEQHYTSFLRADTELPMMYMPDAIRGTLRLMDAPAESLRIRSSYNFAGLSFTPSELAAAIRKLIPGFRIDYKPDFRQAIADSWPHSIDDSYAREDWGWQAAYDLDRMAADMLAHI